MLYGGPKGRLSRLMPSSLKNVLSSIATHAIVPQERSLVPRDTCHRPSRTFFRPSRRFSRPSRHMPSSLTNFLSSITNVLSSLAANILSSIRMFSPTPRACAYVEVALSMNLASFLTAAQATVQNRKRKLTSLIASLSELELDYWQLICWSVRDQVQDQVQIL